MGHNNNVVFTNLMELPPPPILMTVPLAGMSTCTLGSNLCSFMNVPNLEFRSVTHSFVIDGAGIAVDVAVSLTAETNSNLTCVLDTLLSSWKEILFTSTFLPMLQVGPCVMK